MATLKNTTINDTGYLGIPSGTTSERTKILEKVDSYTTPGSYTWVCPTNVYSVEFLVVAGGGGGGAGTESGGGGGAGGLIHRKKYAVTPGNSYPVVVGAGGAGAVWVNTETVGFGSNGGNSSFNSIAATGGGGGAYNNQYGLAGGSGGGATDAPNVYGGLAVEGQGNDGGNAYAHGVGSAGGGGAGSRGRDNLGHGDALGTRLGKAGDGGDGLYFEWLEAFGLGDAGWVASGGAGGARVNSRSFTAGTGRPGGGGNGGVYPSTNPTSGIDGTGGGGGGGGGDPAIPGALNGGDGGDGIVAIHYFQAANLTDARGLVRYNSDIKGVEIFDGHAWLADNLEVNFAGHNKLRYSEQLENGVYQLNAATITSNAIASPFGQLVADKLVETSSSSAHFILQNSSITVGKWYVHSVFAKAAEKTFIQIAHSSGFASDSWVNFDLNSGTYSVRGDNTDRIYAQMDSYGNGWYRCSLAAQAASTTSGRMVVATANSLTDARLNATVGNPANGVYLYGMQFEEGKSPGPYTLTVSAATEIPVVLDGYRYHVYKNVGTSGFTPAFTGEVEVLVVAGGGAGGGGDVGAGGGGGGVIYRKSYPVNWGTKYVVTVGAGGTGVANSTAVGGNGANSSFDKLVAIGGGGGAGWSRGYGSAGGSGGGSTANAASGTYALPGIRGQGSPGGKFGLPSADYPQPGGGGAGGPGSAPDATTRRAGDGGFGVYIPEFASIGGEPAGWFGGAGGGGVESGQTADRGIGIGGLGGGGDGGRQNTTLVAQSGTANTGGGGGGEDPRAGGNGGSGIVAIRYRVY